MFTDSAKTDSTVIALALDTSGNVIAQQLSPLSSAGALTDKETLFSLLPGMDRQKVVAGGWLAGPVTIQGKPTKNLAIVFGLFIPR
jgi:hypothetical protein